MTTFHLAGISNVSRMQGNGVGENERIVSIMLIYATKLGKYSLDGDNLMSDPSLDGFHSIHTHFMPLNRSTLISLFYLCTLQTCIIVSIPYDFYSI